MAVVWRAAIKQKRELVSFYFYFSFIAVVQAALSKFPLIANSSVATCNTQCCITEILPGTVAVWWHHHGRC